MATEEKAWPTNGLVKKPHKEAKPGRKTSPKPSSATALPLYPHAHSTKSFFLQIKNASVPAHLKSGENTTCEGILGTVSTAPVLPVLF